MPGPELAPLRTAVSAGCGRLIAAMSRLRLADVTQQVRGRAAGGADLLGGEAESFGSVCDEAA